MSEDDWKAQQYSQLCEDYRHYTTQLYVVPGIFLAVVGTGLTIAPAVPSFSIRLVFLVGLGFVCHAFVTMFAKLAINQREIRVMLNNLESSTKGLVTLGRTTGLEKRVKSITLAKDEMKPLMWLFRTLPADATLTGMMLVGLFVVAYASFRTLMDRLFPSCLDGTLARSVVAFVLATVRNLFE